MSLDLAIDYGRIDGIDGTVVRGWAFDGREGFCSVDIFLDDVQVGTATADQYRCDLKEVGTGSSCCAFRFSIPEALLTGAKQSLSVRLSGTGRELVGSPIEIVGEHSSAGPSLAAYLEESIAVLRRMLDALLPAHVETAITRSAEALEANRPVLVCGNGGSAADAQHITGELVGRFLKERRGLKAICLSSNAAVLTAWANDYAYETVFSRQVEAYGEPGGVLIGLSTSGNSKNVVEAFKVARALGMTTVALTGEGGGRLKDVADVLIAVPSRHTPLIQQGHICIYHYICECIEARLADP